MSNIYQLIWNADQATNGVKPILDTEQGDPNVGYVKVNSQLDSDDEDLRVLTEVVIPEHKMTTYNLCRKLFNNYALMEHAYEVDTPEEQQEVHDLVQAMIDTPPMEVARKYIEEQSGQTYTRERWYSTIVQLWFERFSQGGRPHLTGFEHVVVGEGQGTIARGYHFWYRYYLDDGFARQVDGTAGSFPGLRDDRILYRGSKQSDSQDQFPESVTISYRWSAPDYGARMQDLEKAIGGFFVGCSVEGLLALGTVRALGPHKQATIEGARYDLVLGHRNDRRHIRTFYPKFMKAVSKPSGKIRIIAALVNPEGHDPGKETVTLINVGAATEPLDGWHIRDKNFRSEALGGVIRGGHTLRVMLTGYGVQFANNGGTIELLDDNGDVVHSVSYPKAEARKQGETLLFGDE